MGKRKRATKPPPKKKTPKLDRIFDCPFCWHEKSVECYIQRDESLGKIECRVCGVKYTTSIHNLDEEIDVYTKWIDACEEANTRKSTGGNMTQSRTASADVDIKNAVDTTRSESPPLEDDENDVDQPGTSGEVEV